MSIEQGDDRSTWVRYVFGDLDAGAIVLVVVLVALVVIAASALAIASGVRGYGWIVAVAWLVVYVAWMRVAHIRRRR